MKKVKRNFYAISYSCGVATGTNGGRFGQYYSFQSKSCRDSWADSGGDFRSSRDWREPIPASDSELRRILTNAPQDILTSDFT